MTPENNQTCELNVYDPAGRFDLNAVEAEKLFNRVEALLTKRGWKVDRVCALTANTENDTARDAVDEAFAEINEN